MAINFLEDMIRVVSPGTARRRAYDVAALELYSDQLEAYRKQKNMRQRSYEAAALGRRTAGWDATHTSANAEIWRALPLLRYRSRDLVRNNPYAKRAISVIANNTVGAGIKPKINNKRVKKLWDAFANSTECDFDGHLNFYGLEHKAMESAARDGECIILKRRKATGFPIQFQILEADYIDHYRNLAQAEKGGDAFIFNGIQFDQSGRIQGYWLWDRHPGEAIRMGTSSSFYPASDVIHVFKSERPGQHRGIPEGVAVFNILRDLDFFQDAERQKQSAAACFSVILENPAGDGLPDKGNQPMMTERLEPGMIQETKPGQKVQVLNPPVFNAYPDYVKSNLYSVSSGYGIPYHALTSDLEHATFSSMKAGDRQFGQQLTVWQEHLMIPKMCNPCFNWFVDACRLFRYISPSEEVEVTWTNPRREMIDPPKEVKAKMQELQSGQISYYEMWRERGDDPNEVMDEMADFYKEADKRGIKLSGDFRQDLITDDKKIGKDVKAARSDGELEALLAEAGLNEDQVDDIIEQWRG